MNKKRFLEIKIRGVHTISIVIEAIRTIFWSLFLRETFEMQKPQNE